MRVREIVWSIQGAENTHGGTYLDLVTGKPRQFDFRCILRRDERSIQFAVECKNLSASAPTVICGIDRSMEEAFHEVIEARCGLFKEPNAVLDGAYSLTRRVANSRVYRQGHFTGKSVIRLKPSNNKDSIQGYTKTSDAEVYDGWDQALSSAYDVCKSASEYARKFSKRHFFTVTIPVVVVPDESLWMLKYDDDGIARSEPCLTDNCPFFVDRGLSITGWNADQKFSLSHIHFCTLSGFKSLVVSVQDNEATWLQWFPSTLLEKCKEA